MRTPPKAAKQQQHYNQCANHRHTEVYPLRPLALITAIPPVTNRLRPVQLLLVTPRYSPSSARHSTNSFKSYLQIIAGIMYITFAFIFYLRNFIKEHRNDLTCQ